MMRRYFQKGRQQVFIDSPQTGDSCPRAKFMKHAHVWCPVTMMDVRKGSPRSLLGKQPCQSVEAMDRRQYCQQVSAIKLSGTQKISTAWMFCRRK